MKYQQSKTPQFGSRTAQNGNVPSGADFERNSSGQRPSGTNGTGAGFSPVSGTIISQDDTSITVELADGSSKIVLIAENTSINKTEEGSSEDLAEGTEVIVFGQENSDGSVTAQNIQIGGEMIGRM